MTIIKWEPFKNMALLQDRINRMFEDAFPTTRQVEDDLADCDWQPTVDIYETEQGLAIQADLPGVEKADVSLEIKDSVLTLSGERRREATPNEDLYLRKERGCGKFSRSFNLQRTVDPATITARFKNGVLRIDIPKPEEEKPRKITVSID